MITIQLSLFNFFWLSMFKHCVCFCFSHDLEELLIIFVFLDASHAIM